MKKTIKMGALALFISLGAISCKKKISDTDLQAEAAKIVLANPNASVTVKDGQAHLEGAFADDASKNAMIESLKGIKGIAGVHDMATIEVAIPVTTVTEVQQKVKDALKDFPSVKAEMLNAELTLTGNVSKQQALKVKESIDALKIGKYSNKLTIK